MLPEHRSKLNHIYLALLFYADDRTTFGNQATFRILIEELNFLRNTGITVGENDNTKTIYFDSPLIFKDNLRQNSILGFIESFRVNYFCGFGKMSK